MKMFGIGHSGSMTFPMSYDYQGEYYDYSRKGWKGLSSLEKSLSVSLGITSTLSVALMIAVIVVGVTRDKDGTCNIVGTTTVNGLQTPPTTTAPPVDPCNVTRRPRPPRRGSGATSPTELPSTTDTNDAGPTTESTWMPSMGTAECIVSGGNGNSTICLAPQCFRMAGRIIDSIDFSEDPCQNFYSFACGNWIKNNPIPEYTHKWDQADILQEKVLREVREILEVDPSTNDSRSLRLAKSFYHSCLHSPDDEVSVAEMRLLLQQMATLDSQQDRMMALSSVLGNLRRFLNGNYIVSLDVNVNDGNTRENAIYLDQPMSGLSFLLQEMDIDIPNLNDYLYQEQTEGVPGLPQQVHENYRDLAKKLWVLIYPGDILNVEKVLNQIFAFDRNLTSIRNSTSLSTDQDDPENPTTFLKLGEIDDAELNSTMISWLSGFVNAVISGTATDDDGANQSELIEIPPSVILRNLEYFRKLETLLKETDGEVIEKYLKLRILLSYGIHGSLAFKTIFHDFKQAVAKNELPSPRWQMCSKHTNQFFGWTISEKFLTVFDEITKEQLNLTVKYLKEEFNETLDEVDWIARNETRQYAQGKIKELRTFLGFPDWWHDRNISEDSVNSFVEGFYYDMNFTDASNYFQNYIEAVMWMSKKRLGEVYLPTLHSGLLHSNQWPKFEYPTKMLSYYFEYLNYLVLPTGVIDRSNSLMEYTFPSIHYGSLGITLALEMLESIVGEGRFRQADGSIGRWWDNETAENYRNITECFEEQFLNLEEIKDQDQRTSTLIEDNILYNGALSIVYEAYISETFEQEFDEVLLPGLQDYSPEQLLFLSFAQSQCSHRTPTPFQNNGVIGEELVKSVLSNSVQFARHWNCPLPAEEKTCRVFF